MRRIALTGATHDLRARRWDALVLGSALPGLVAAVRLGMAGLRVAVVEEETSARIAPLLREPFSLTGARAGGVVHECLRALGVPLIERRSLAPQEIAHQVLLPECRLDVGGPSLSAEELVAWGLAKPDAARDWVEAVSSGSRAQLEALLAAPLLRRGARRALPRAASGRRPRGRPDSAADTPPGLDDIVGAQLRALSHLATAALPPEARLRLLGSALEGGAGFADPALTLRSLLRRRIEALHGEFRMLDAPFELVEIGGHPGLARRRPGEAWLGRLLLLNAPEACLARVLREAEHPVPGFLKGPVPTHRWAALQLRVEREAVPEGLAPRAILAEAIHARAVRLALHPSPQGADVLELVASRMVEDDAGALEAQHAALEATVREFLPFSEGRLERVAVAPRPSWDDELALIDPAPGSGWPAELDIRRSSRPLVYALPRCEVAALGIEGDLLLGWRAGDTLADELG